VGLDFLSHPFWDKYLEYEERLDAEDKVFALLDRIVHIPMHQYARYFERYRAMAPKRPLIELAPASVLDRYRQEIEQQPSVKARAPADMERDLRLRVDGYHMDHVFNTTQTETTKRWTYESEIKRPYYHVTELDDAQLDNWRKYLDFEEDGGDYSRTKFLYERCLVTAANYDEFWFRYVRWMLAREGNKSEEVRNILQRASYMFVPIAKPSIRLFWAKFEESQDYPDIAADILEAILMVMPSHLETILALVNLNRRQQGLDTAIQTLKRFINGHDVTQHVRGALVAEWARLVADIRGEPGEARKIYSKHEQQCLSCQPYWVRRFFFEVKQAAAAGEQQGQHYERVKSVYDAVRSRSELPSAAVKQITTFYLDYLQECGPSDAMKELIDLDKQINGPGVHNRSVGDTGNGVVETRAALENGLGGAGLSENAGAYYGSGPQSANGQGIASY
jgi:pre-mRNA-processing factor 39